MSETTGESWTITIPQPVLWGLNAALFGFMAFGLSEGWGFELSKPVILAAEENLAPPPEAAGTAAGWLYALLILMLAGMIVAVNAVGLLITAIIAALSAVAFLWTTGVSISRLRAYSEDSP